MKAELLPNRIDEIGRLEYYNIHNWLRYHYKKGELCENKSCTNINPKRLEWALINGLKYEKKRENYIVLCKPCHSKYDYCERIRINKSISHKGKPALNKRAVILNDTEIFDDMSSAAIQKNIVVSTIHNNINGLSKKTRVGVWKYYNQEI